MIQVGHQVTGARPTRYWVLCPTVRAVPETDSFEATSETPGSYVVVMKGEWDVANVASIAEEFARLAAIDGAQICVDLCATTFMDSTLLGELVTCCRAVEPRLSVRCVTGPALRVFEETGLAEYLSVSSA